MRDTVVFPERFNLAFPKGLTAALAEVARRRTTPSQRVTMSDIVRSAAVAEVEREGIKLPEEVRA
jgi:hypothetical protein